MTHNNRPIDDARLQKALDEIKQVFARYGFAGCAMVIAPEEGAFHYAMHAPWSAIQYDPATPLGWRLRSNSQKDGRATTEARIEGAVHTVCQLADFGAQTMDWMEQIKLIIRQAGIEFDHTPFGGQALPKIGLGKSPEGNDHV